MAQSRMKLGQSFLQFLRPKSGITPSEIPAAANGQDLHLLSIEGRGVCGLSSLIILKEVLHQYQYHQKLPQLPRPCDVFDLAGGTGTGGIVVILLFRLGMTVDEAITSYTSLSKYIFSKKTVLLSQKKANASRLEDAIARVIHSSLNIDESRAQKILMLDDSDKGSKCFVIASTPRNLSSPTLFRTYVPPRHASYNCTIVEAIRATTAEEPFFPSVDIGDMKETFIHVGSRISNPVQSVLQEAMSIFPSQCISCLVSIGSGAQGITGFETASTTAHAEVLKKILNDGEHILDGVAKGLSDSNVFFCRLNVDRGLENIGFEDWERFGDVKTHTGKYLENFDITHKVSQLVQVLNRRTATAVTVEESLRGLSKFLDGLISTVPGERWTTLISEFVRTAKLGKAATDTLNMQCALLRDTLESCMQGGDFVELPDEVKESIRQLLEGLKKTFQDSPGQEDPMAHVNTNIQKLLQHFWLQNHIAGNIALHNILKYIRKDDSTKRAFTRLEQHAINQNLKDLNVAPSAAYDSFEVSDKVPCFKGTRIRLLNEIASWIASNDPSLAPIYVLDGVAGIGKSTIAKTVAEHAAGINVLGASFFFSRNDGERKTAKTFFPTIAYQLAHYDKDFANKINEALLRNPHVVTQVPIKQSSTLIMEPLKEALAVVGNPILIVIDALDECGPDGDVLLKIFADSIKNLPRLKVFITSRPEYHIRNVLDRYHHLKRFHLQDIERSVVQSDIRLYLDFHLSENQVRDKFPGLQVTWKPAKRDIEMLIETCGTLFIIASTAVRFILDEKQLDPAKQLTWLLPGVSRQDISSSNHTTAMDSIYTQILLAAVPSNDHTDWFRRYQIVVGAILALQYPLPCITLSALVDLVPDDVKRSMFHLYSLVAPTGQELTFRIHHKSLPDFVTSPSRCEPRFLINLKTCHLELGKRCLKIIDSQLKTNVSNLGTIRLKESKDVQCHKQQCISQELTYASTHWATHLINGGKIDTDAERLLEEFACKHFLSWLEVLSAIGQMEIAHSSLAKISKLLDGCKMTAGITREILHDGCRFIALNIELIKVATGHFFSAFAFVPQDTRLFQTYKGMKGINLKVISGYEKTWNPTISIMTGHENLVSLVTFSGDGTKLASTSDDRTVRLWDGQTGAEIAVLRGHSNSVKSTAFSADGTKLASASSDGTVRLWDGQTGAEIATLQGHSRSVNCVAFSPDGTRLASSSDDRMVRLWDGETGAEISVLQGDLYSVYAVVFSPDGTKLASASYDTVRLWDVQAGAELAVLRGHTRTVHSVVFSSDGTKLASASNDLTVRLWDSGTGAELAVLEGHLDSVNIVIFSADGTKLASGSGDGTVRLWDGRTGTGIAVLEGHSNAVNSTAFSADGTKLASASGDGTVRLWDGQTGAAFALLRGHSSSVKSVSFALDGRRLASASDDGTVRLWDSQTCAKSAVHQGHSHLVNSLVFSPNGTKLASASDDGTVRLWDGRTGIETAVLRGHSYSVNSAVFSPDGTKLASGSVDCTVRLWDGQTGADIALLEGHSRSVSAVIFSPDGKKLASTSSDETVRMWDGHTGAEIAVLRGHSNSVNSAVFSPDGTKLASVSFDRTVRLWDSETGAEIATLQGHSNWVNTAVFSSDGTRLASADVDEMVQLWDIQSGIAITQFFGNALVGFPSDGSGLLLIDINSEVNIRTEDKFATPLATFIESNVNAECVPGLNLWVVRAVRKQPRLSALLVVKVEEGVPFYTSLCWFPPDLPINNLAVSSLSRVAVGCRDGRIILLDADLSSFL